MSRPNKDEKSAAAPPPTKPVTLPTLPKYDDHNREKWSQEYDKVEAELLKNHLAAPNCMTTTLGLRLLPAQWDRTIPTGEIESKSKRRPLQNFSQTEPPRSKTTEPGMNYSLARLSPIGSASPALSARPSTAMAARNVTNTLAAVHVPSMQEIVRILIALVDPPLQFKTSFSLNSKGMDPAWIMKYQPGDRIPSLNTLETVREDMLLNPSAKEEVAVNSPRSVIVLLRNGVSVDDLQALPLSNFVSSERNEDGALMAHKHHEQRRKDLLTSLREEYRALCGEMPLIEILDSISAAVGGQVGEEEATFISKRREKQKKVLLTNREKQMKQLDYEAELQRRVLEAEQTRLQHEDEMNHKRQEKRSQALKMADVSLQRMQELREQTANLGIEFVRKMEERKARLEEKERVRNAARAQAAEEHKKELEAKLNAKKARLAQNQAQLHALQAQQETRFEEKERDARQRRLKLEAEKEAQKGHITEQQRKAEEAREVARQKAKEHEADLQRVAEEKRLHAEEKLRQYFHHLQEKRERERVEEEKRKVERRAVQKAAETKALNRKQEIIHQRDEQENHIASVRRERDSMLAAQREVERLAADDKRYLVTRQTRALEFTKLVSVARIHRKEEKADIISKQRQKLLEATLADREASRREKEKIEHEMVSRLSNSPRRPDRNV